ncbi:MAG: prolipoprotein diacylglyceryl transferase [Terracidiphilus sp.]|nr:prolipoprotein diacylglyceryl transferase [Terracidiphilus sp.]
MHPVLFHIGSILIPAYGASAAVGVLLALLLAQRTARMAGLNPAQVWNLCIVSLFAALLGQRLLLIVLNWSDLRSHPSWMLGLAMIHHPLLAVAGAFMGLGAAALVIRRQKMPFWTTVDVLAAPLTLGLAFEQLGALLAGSGYGTETTVRWAVIYTSPLAARWSGTPLGIALHPVQAYAALAFLTLSIFLLVWLPERRRQGDLAGLWLMGTGVAVYITELVRDPIGRGSLLRGALDGPQAAAVLLVLAGALVLLERKATGKPDKESAVTNPGTAHQGTKNEAEHG